MQIGQVEAVSNLAKLRVYEAKQQHLGQLAERLAQSPGTAARQFWSAFNSEFRPRDGDRCAVQRGDGSVIADASEKAALLNAHFAGISSSRPRHAAACGQCRADPTVEPYIVEHVQDFLPPPAAVRNAPTAGLDRDFTAAELNSAIAALRGHKKKKKKKL